MSKDKISLAEKDRMAFEAINKKAESRAKSMDEGQAIISFAKDTVAQKLSIAAMFTKLHETYGNPETGFPQWYKLRKEHVKPEGVYHNLRWLWDDLQAVYKAFEEAVTERGGMRNHAKSAWSDLLKHGVQRLEGGNTREPKPSRQVIREHASAAYRKIMRDDFATDEMCADAEVLFAMAVRYGADAAKLADIVK